MAKLVFGMNQSLDGYVDHDAFAPSPALFRHFIEQARSQAGSVYGRRMYEVMRYWDDDHPEWDAGEQAFAAAWRRQPKWVASRSITSVGPNATLLSADLEGAIRALKAERDGEIEVAGPDLAHSLTMLGLIDEYRIYLHPVVLGRGKPYFAGPRPPLRLVAHDRVDESVVRLTYVPAWPRDASKDDGPRPPVEMARAPVTIEDSSKLLMLRHAIATVAYRGAKALRGAPGDFGAFRIRPGSRTPVEILAHIGDLFDWALRLAEGNEVWHDAVPQAWDQEVERFFRSVRACDDLLDGARAIACPPERLLQGPVADALTHVGQIAMLRRLSDAPIRGENYFRAQVAVGQVGPEQAPPRREFD